MAANPKLRDALAALQAVSPADLEGDRHGRIQLAAAARRLLARAETPFDRAWRLAATDISGHAARRTLEDLGVWEGWARSGAAEASLDDLGAFCKTPCDPVLLRRLLRLLAAEHYIDDAGEDRYGATPMSLALGNKESPTRQMFKYLNAPAPVSNLPKFLKETGYENPEDPATTSYEQTDPDGLTFSERLAASPEAQYAYVKAMEGLAADKADWTDIYTETQALLDGFDPRGGGVFMVDLGGGHGLDTTRLLSRYPDLPAGSLVVQDLPDVLKLAKVPEKITLCPYDFFTPQPIQAARVYFMHTCLHDWDDIDARRILKHLVAAMKPGYSKFLLYETVIPKVGATTYQAMVDISMMYAFSAAERTESKWTWLLTGAGLKVVKIWNDLSSSESIIEAERAVS